MKSVIANVFNYITKPTLSVFEFISIGTLIMLVISGQWAFAALLFPLSFIIQIAATFTQNRIQKHSQ